MFGFTNNTIEFDRVCRFRDDAIADGWQQSAIWDNEPIESACNLQKDGFKIHVITRTKQGKWKYEADLTCWAPDKLQIVLPKEYNMQNIISNTQFCDNCKTRDVETVRYSFAGRCCKNCLPAMQKKHEYPGWTN